MDNVIKDLKDIYEFEYVCYDLDNDREKFLNFDENEKLPVIEFVDNNGNVLKTINGEHSKKEVENILISLEEK